MIEGEKVILRKLEEEDLPRVLSWINDSEIAYYMGIQGPVSLSEHKNWYEKLLHDPTKEIFAIVLKEGNKHIGNIGFDTLNWRNRNARLTIFIGDRSLRGQGIGYDALTIFLDYCFNTLNLNRIYLLVHEDNQPAIRLYEKCGFKKEGLLRNHEYYNGKYINKIIMGLLKSEFERKVG